MDLVPEKDDARLGSGSQGQEVKGTGPVKSKVLSFKSIRWQRLSSFATRLEQYRAGEVVGVVGGL